MNHLDDDKLLQFVLETIEEAEISEIRGHLSLCEQCRRRESKVQKEVERLGAVQLQIDKPELLSLPGASNLGIRRWGWVAGLAAGFLLGFLTAQLTGQTNPIAVPQRLVTTGIPTPSSGYIPCQAMDVKVASALQ